MNWDSDAIIRKAAEWVWIPNGSETIVGAGVTMLHDFRGLSILTAEPDGEADGWVGRVIGLAATVGADTLTWPVHPLTRPTDLDRHLRAHGATVAEELDISAFPLDEGLPDLDPPMDVDVSRIDSADGLTAAWQVDAEVFGGATPDPGAKVADIEDLQRQVAAGPERTVLRYLAHIDGELAATAGSTMDGGAVKLWGGAVLPRFRGRGAYRALVAARVAEGIGLGAGLALVKARTGTSGPILRRAGFTAYGTETVYRIDLRTESGDPVPA